MAHLCEMPTHPTSPDFMCPECGKRWSAMVSAGGLSWREAGNNREPDLFGGQR